MAKVLEPNFSTTLKQLPFMSPHSVLVFHKPWNHIIVTFLWPKFIYFDDAHSPFLSASCKLEWGDINSLSSLDLSPCRDSSFGSHLHALQRLDIWEYSTKLFTNFNWGRITILHSSLNVSIQKLEESSYYTTNLISLSIFGWIRFFNLACIQSKLQNRVLIVLWDALFLFPLNVTHVFFCIVSQLYVDQWHIAQLICYCYVGRHNQLIDSNVSAVHVCIPDRIPRA